MSVAVRQHGQPPPEGLLPGYQPTTLKLIVNRLSRHKVSRLIYDFGSRAVLTNRGLCTIMVMFVYNFGAALQAP